MTRKTLPITFFFLFSLLNASHSTEIGYLADGYVAGEIGGNFEESFGNEYEYLNQASYELPTIKFTLDGYLFSRVGGDIEQPLILSGEFPAPPSLTAGDLGFEGRIGGRAELYFYAKDQRFAPRASLLWTGTELSRGERTHNPADVIFFNAVAADPASGYTARNRSRFMLGDVGLRRTVSPIYGWSASFAYGELIESLDLISAPDADPGTQNQTPGGNTNSPSETGFFSQTHNKFVGFQMGMDAQLWSNGRSKLEGALTAGVFGNEISVGAQAENAQQDWNFDKAAFIGTLNLTFVIPADPVNFRLGYQGVYLDGMALPVTQSRERQIISGQGSDVTDQIWYHGFLFGIEWLR